MARNEKMVSRYFRKYGFAPATVIDVGVLSGTPFLYKSFPDAKFILVDPLEESRAAVTKAWSGRIDFDFHVCGASEEEGEVDLTIPVGRPALATASSARNNDRSEGAERRRVPTRRLDDVVAGATGPYGLKVDTEGHELSVLKGGLGILAQCEFVITETSIKRRFPEGYRFSEMVAFMADQGFELHSILSGLTRSPRFADILWVKWDSPRFDMTPRTGGHDDSQ
jgi:FkbM family methyltransferase